MNSFFSVDLIFFIMIAALLVFRLRNVLGRRTGNEKKPGFGFSFDAKVLDKNSNNIKEIKINKEHEKRDCVRFRVMLIFLFSHQWNIN